MREAEDSRIVGDALLQYDVVPRETACRSDETASKRRDVVERNRESRQTALPCGM